MLCCFWRLMRLIGRNITSYRLQLQIFNGDGRFHATSSKKDLYLPVQATTRIRWSRPYLE
jgi:hypothetical protein